MSCLEIRSEFLCVECDLAVLGVCEIKDQPFRVGCKGGVDLVAVKEASIGLTRMFRWKLAKFVRNRFERVDLLDN